MAARCFSVFTLPADNVAAFDKLDPLSYPRARPDGGPLEIRANPHLLAEAPCFGVKTAVDSIPRLISSDCWALSLRPFWDFNSAVA